MPQKDNIKIPRDRWRFYRLLEEELIKFDRIIPVDSNQLNVKSPKLAEIIYSACIHFDSLLKEIAIQTKKLKKDGSLKVKDKPKNRKNETVWPSIRHYKNFFPEFSVRRIIILLLASLSFNLLTPFAMALPIAVPSSIIPLRISSSKFLRTL